MSGPGKRILQGLESALKHIGCPLCKGRPWTVLHSGRPPRVTVEPCPNCGAKVHEVER